MPGRSTKRKRFSAWVSVPSARVTVLPGQLPVCCRRPVSALKTVDFPVYDRMSGSDAYLHTLGPLELPAKGSRAGLDTSEPRSALVEAITGINDIKSA